ncbi:hypothetical protein Hdeb2414_s0004g00144541 [Helianthus debilis subsp. tardiflorus]
MIRSDDTSCVVLGDAEATPGKDAIAKTTKCRLDGGKYVNVLNVKGFTKSGSSKPFTRRSSRHLLKGSSRSSTLELVDVSDDIEASDDQEPEVEGKSKKGKERPLVVGKKSKGEGKKVVLLASKGSPRKSREGSTDVNPGDVYVPDWNVKVGDNFKSSAVCEDVLAHFGPPMVRGSLATMDDDLMISRMMKSAYNFSFMLPEGVSRFRKRMQEFEEFLKKMDKRKASLAALKKEAEGFAEKEKILL